MKTATLIKILLAMSVVWLAMALPTWLNFRDIDRHADGYRTARLIVSASYCGIHGNPERCRLEGTIDGAEVSLVTSTSRNKPDAEGAQIKVLYNPELSRFGRSGQSLQVLEWTGDIGAEGRRFRIFSMALAVSSLVLTLAVHILFLSGVRRRTGIGDETFEADLGGAKPAGGVPLLALGLTFILWQIPRFLWAGLIFGLVLTVLGLLLLRSRHLHLEKAPRRLTLGRQLLGRRLASEETMLPPDAGVRISHGMNTFVVSVGAKPSFIEIVRAPLHEDARRLGEAMAEWLPAPLDDNTDP